MELLKYTNMALDFCPYSRRINGSILKYVAIDATKKTSKKTSHVEYFIVSMALISLNIYTGTRGMGAFEYEPRIGPKLIFFN